jgi:dienelactone hydrolase
MGKRGSCLPRLAAPGSKTMASAVRSWLWGLSCLGYLLASPASWAQEEPRSPAVATPAASAALPSSPAPAPSLAQDLRETVLRLRVEVADMFGRREPREIAVTVFRPPGEGPSPLLIFNHGRSADNRATPPRQRPETLARWATALGFVVMVPTRVGYGETAGDFDPEASGPCNDKRYAVAAQAASDQVLAVQALARSLPYVDASRWLVAGQSMGGFTTLATVARQPTGLVGAINFAGGGGGNPLTQPGRPCDPDALRRLWASQGAQAQVPNLWLYWRNDLYWGEALPRQWHQAWAGAARDARARTAFEHLPAVGKDGHGGIGQDMNTWVPLAEAFLSSLGFAQSGLPRRPPASGFARVEEADKLPASAAVRERYQRFLELKPPRAFALSADGAWGYASGDWALGKALGNCQRGRASACRLYAVDEEVVWTP